MILLMRNHVGEFVPGCDYTVVRLEPALIRGITRRVAAFLARDPVVGAVAEIRYWDINAECMSAPDPEKAEAIEDALDRGDGWAILNEAAVGPFDADAADCTQMVIVTSNAPAVAWSYRVGSEPVRTVDVPLAGLAARLGSPLGNPLRGLP
jgi:hypothetical protein